MFLKIVAALAVVAVVVFGGMKLSQKSAENPSDGSTQSVSDKVVAPSETATTNEKKSSGETTPASGETKKGSLADLLKLKESVKCTFSGGDAKANSTGTVYASGGSVRADIVINLLKQKIATHLLQSGGYSYIWSDVSPNGIKMKTPESSASAGGSGGAVDTETKVDYSCSSWSPDSALLTPPKNITFSASVGQ